ncbi:MAG: glycoside hydrolase [Candidatus Brocadia carolinensis]|uniref:Glycoside hydrolase n=1 Tax=Candidatus Brocadia carolinensis TaxID=1004156 RepID=A0A1V4AXX2_9BACT|nr:MAG: glycoside hydrolase [Candidatus Brocadia caroliniensis]
MEKGYLSFILHAHLPFVRHPEYTEFLEEDWLFEAITETYIPLIDVFDKLIEDGVNFRMTVSMSPPLVSMLTDPLLQSRYIRYIEKRIEFAEKEIERTRHQSEFHRLAQMYHGYFTNARYIFAEKYRRNLVAAFKKFQDAGNVEIITCGATHGYFPLMNHNVNAMRAQVRVAVNHYEKHFGRRPGGIWLAECAYEPEIDKILQEAGIRFLIMETHGILFASPRPKYGVYAPIMSPSGIAAFGRDRESSKQVWSAREGYPGDFFYREFYRDVGFDLDYDYVRPYLHGDGKRSNIGIKYYRITGKTDQKEPYCPHKAMERAAEHAGNFLFNREKQIEHLSAVMDRKPIVIAPYDAELFGHWWFEGPRWIDFLFRKMSSDYKTISLITPMEYLEKYPDNQASTPALSSWGYKGYHEYWLNESNDWIYRHLHKAAERMVELAKTYPQRGENSLQNRALNQAARELLLAQSSDWAFIMKTGDMVEYAVKRTKEHIFRFTKLYDDIRSDKIDAAWLSDIEGKDNIFSDIEYHIYQ